MATYIAHRQREAFNESATLPPLMDRSNGNVCASKTSRTPDQPRVGAAEATLRARAGYLDRNWPPALKASGEWPLASLRHSFLNGGLTRLVDPDTILKSKIVEFVDKGELGLASGKKATGGFERQALQEPGVADTVLVDEV